MKHKNNNKYHMSTNRPSMEEMSGESDSQGSPKLPLNTIRINGSKGRFVYQDVVGGLKEGKDGKKRYETRDLGEEVKLVFIKVRRKLSQYRKGEAPLATNEHTHKGQVVTLFGASKKPLVGVASDLREAYPGLRTQQIVYALYEGELVRVIFKGASLGSEVKDKNEHNFYSYIASFDGKSEHFYACETILFPLQEESSMGSYYCIGYRRGDALPDERVVGEVAEAMFKVYRHCKNVDEYYCRNNTSFGKKEEEVNDSGEMGGLEDNDELSEDEIPF